MAELRLLPEIVHRKSVTNWIRQPIEAQTWTLLLEAARHAPSSWNRQPARYVLVTDHKAKETLCDTLHRTNRWAVNAAGLIVQVARPEDDDVVDEKSYYLYDCGLAVMSLVYQAQALGISSRQMTGFDEVAVRLALGIPDGYRVVVIVGFGYPSETGLAKRMVEAKRRLTSQHKRIALSELVHSNRWNGGE